MIRAILWLYDLRLLILALRQFYWHEPMARPSGIYLDARLALIPTLEAKCQAQELSQHMGLHELTTRAFPRLYE